MIKKTFCPYPFTRAHISTSGTVFTCCSSRIKVPIGNIFKESPEEVWNSGTAIAIRESIINGSLSFCRQEICPIILSGQIHQNPIPDNLQGKISQKEFRMSRGPEEISLNYDYSCNLFCKSCRKNKRFMAPDVAEKFIKFQDTFIKSSFFKQTNRLIITGAGEPFTSIVYQNLFNKIKREEYPNIKITLRTNGTLLSPENWQKIKGIHYAIDRISISVDAATKKTYQTLRRGGNFKDLVNNIKYLASIKNKYNFKIRLNFVIQEENYREMVKFVKLAKKYNCDRVVFTKLLNKGTFSPDYYSQLAIHDPGHSDHAIFNKMIKKKIFKDPIVTFKLPTYFEK